MSIGVMNWVWTHSNSRNGSRLVLLAIADCASGDGANAWPSVAALSQKSGLGERAVQNAINDLVKIGELEVSYNAGPRGCNRYRVIMDADPPPQNLHPAESAPPQNQTPTPAESAPGTVIEPKDLQKPPTEVSAQLILGAFIDWVRDHDGELTRRTIGQLAKQIGDLIDQGVPERFIRKGLADWHARDQHPATLDSFVNSAMNAAARSNSPPKSRRQQETDALFDAALRRARAKDREQ